MQKPPKILALEKQLNISLSELKTGKINDWNNKDTYQLDASGVLVELNLIDNQISDISFLSSLTSLTALDLSGNQISDTSFLGLLTNLTLLDLNESQISDISFLQRLTSLTSLYLSGNQISDISFLKPLTGLTTLSLSANKISDFSFLKLLTGLTTLYLSANKISDISFLQRLTGLTTLNLSSNQISDISFLKRLTGLTSLELSFNQISDISFLQRLTGLTTLYLDANQISDISFLQRLTGLTTLYLDDNQISDISFLQRLTGLITLYLSNNQISDISFLQRLTGLTTLDLSANQIREIQFVSDLIKKAQQLIYLYLSNNNLPIPSECLNDVTKLRSYFTDGTKGITNKRNIKLLFMGDGCVGKSTLLSHLKTLKPPQIIDIDKRTEGVQVDIWSDYFPEHKINVWDFGGQDILHSTHRLFLGERAIYILVWCKESNKKCAKDETHNLSYWLDFIADFGKKSIVLLVENVINDEFSDEYPDEKELKDLKAYYKKRQIDLISTHHKFDCLNDTDEVINFKDIIKNRITQLQRKYPIEKYPSNWYTLQEELAKEKKNNRTISLKKYLEFANNLDISEPIVVLEYLHAAGIVGYYKDLSKEVVVLQLEWILEAIYAGIKLKDNPLTATKGKLNDSHFALIWKEYADVEKQLFKSYMLKSNLLAEPRVYDINREYTYLLPSLFENIKKREAIKWETKEQYIAIKFKFIFKAVMEQLQVRILSICHYDDEETFYKNYISFTDKHNKDAFVEMREKEKELRIFSESSELYQTILNEINKIYSLDRVSIVKRKGEKEEVFKYDQNKNHFLDSEIKNEKNIKGVLPKMKKIFISYSRKDVDYKDELKKHLNILKTFDIADNWSCEEITIGKWHNQIQKELEESDLIIYMLSANFFSSKYILEKEVQKGMELIGKSSGKQILCVIVSDFIGLDKLKSTNKSTSELQDALLKLNDYQYLPYSTVVNKITNNTEEKIMSLEYFSNENKINSALAQITEKVKEFIK